MEDNKSTEIDETIEDKDFKENEEKEINKEDEKKYSDSEVNEIVKAKLKKWKQDEEKRISQAQKLAKMDEAEKLNYEKEQLEKEISELKKEKAKNEMMAVSRSMLREKNISIDDSLISMIISDDADETKEKINLFIDSYSRAVDSEVNERLKSNSPRRMGSSNKLTKDEIFKIKDPVERRKLIAENMELFN